MPEVEISDMCTVPEPEATRCTFFVEKINVTPLHWAVSSLHGSKLLQASATQCSCGLWESLLRLPSYYSSMIVSVAYFDSYSLGRVLELGTHYTISSERVHTNTQWLSMAPFRSSFTEKKLS